METARLDHLWRRYSDGDITKEERQELFRFIALAENRDAVGEKILAEWTRINEGQVTILKKLSTEAAAELFRAVIHTKIDTPVIPMSRKRSWIRWIAAACIIATIAVVGILTNNHPPSTVGVRANDVPAPTNTRAVITLADGSKVYLDSAGNGTIAQENNVAVVKNANGEIEYRGQKSEVGGTIAYNTMFNPRGSKVISLTLSDGTRVWLNSESSLKYPTAFTTSTREVEITGEAYFEVKHNFKQPFKVHLPNGAVVEDIGTAFNVNAYTDEADIKTTLIEGSVKLSSLRPGVLAVKLKPGEQAIINQVNPKITQIEVQTINVSEAIAWKENRFFFDGADIQTIARQLSRWYDVDVEVKDNIPSHFTGIINRDVKVSQVFDMLQKTGAVKFSVEGNRIIITK